MKVFHTPASVRHDPVHYFRRGAIIAHPEQAERYVRLCAAARSAGHEIVVASDHGLAPIEAVHGTDYLEFLQKAWSRRDEMVGGGDEILTGHFARPHMHRRPKDMLGLVGYHTADTSTPIREGTWDAIYGTAQAAIAAADAALASGHAYALCRPPGHHAYADCAGGFCYLNNSAIAAERLLEATGGPVAVLDIDVHHGNGTQGIFCTRRDVLTVSIHADPAAYYPFYAGYADEIGEGGGVGANRNVPLPLGSGDDVWCSAIEAGLHAIEGVRPRALVLSLGLDVAADDPIGAFAVTARGLAAAAQLIARASLPTVIVQEGGYLCEALPTNLVAFLGAFDAARA